MRDNFRPNVRLTTNILMVIGTFLIAFNIAPIAKRARLENLCKELQYTWHRDYKKKSYMDKQETTDWYDKRRKVLNKKINKLTIMHYKGDSLYSPKICDYQIDDFYDFYSD